MATLIPSLNSCLTRMESGERRLAQRLEDKLEDDYLLWYDVPVGPDRLHPDFIILHPKRGIFVLEVKNWRLDTIKQVTPYEWVIAPDGKEKTVKNPLIQARDYALAINSLLETDSALVRDSGRYAGKLCCPYAYGVVLPGITRKMFNSQPALAEVLDYNLVICRDEMTEGVDPGKFQERLWAMSHYDFGTTLSEEQIDRIRWHLYPDIRISSKQLSFFEDDTPTASSAIPEILKVMDLQQEQLARNMGLGHRVIHGVAGSGKTLILVYRCQQLIQEIDGPVLVLCFNVALASRLRQTLQDRGLDKAVTVRHFHGWCVDQLKQNRIPRPSSKNYKGSDYIEQLVNTVIKSVDSGRIPTGQYGAVMVDEGHDFEPEWLRLVAQMVNPNTDSFLLLYDDAQNLYGNQKRKQFSFKSVGIKAQGRTTILKLNYRNSAEVLTLAYEFAKEVMEPSANSDEDEPLIIQPDSAGRHGPLPELVNFQSFQKEVEYIVQRAQKLHERGIPWNEMAVIYRSRFMGEAVTSQLEKASIPTDWINKDSAKRHYDASAKSIKVMTMHASKGLEFPVVFIPGLGYMPNRYGTPEDDARLLYVAMTRAIEYLILTGHQQTEFVRRIQDSLANLPVAA